MQKECQNCQRPYSTKDSRQVTCSIECSLARRKVVGKPTSTHIVVRPIQNDEFRESVLLPPPEELPAPYAKRVHDMWVALTSSKNHNTTRIA